MIRIIDCGSQLTQNIARRVRELGVFTEIMPFHISSDKVKSDDLEGIIISGGQFSVYDENSPLPSPDLLTMGVPVLGICYGQQSIAHILGGCVNPTADREYGQTRVRILRESLLFKRIQATELDVWMSHGDIVEKMPEGFEIVAESEHHIASMQDTSRKLFALQFHPEVDHTDHGRMILNNFIDICSAIRNWDPKLDYQRILDETQAKINGKTGIGGISGGVDSTAVSILISKIPETNYHPIFVNNGLLRLREEDEVQASLKPFGLDVIYADASQRFLEKLTGISDPDQKRKIIGHEFIEVFQEEAKKIENASYLVQGTLYPDVIESVPIYGSSSKIKRHHNVGGLPEKLGLDLVEPFRKYFKDEIRKIADEELGMPKEIVWRHPFPGPGLAVRIMGEVTNEKLGILRQADAIYIDELKKLEIYYDISQAFAGLTSSRAVGVMGDEGTYQAEVRLRAVVTNDFMTSDIYRFGWDQLQKITNLIINRVKGVNRVFYDTTQKPPGTIEWE